MKYPITTKILTNFKNNIHAKMGQENDETELLFFAYDLITGMEELIKEKALELSSQPINPELKLLISKIASIKKEKVKKEKKVYDPPLGTYGEWDYPNTQWPRTIFYSDIKNICSQKQQRIAHEVRHNTFWDDMLEIEAWLIKKEFKIIYDECEALYLS